jgi:tripartite-type tricarboxylate transporter receptor subunit TctC
MKKLAAAAVALALSATSAFAQAYPTKPITLIVPFAAGGPTDIVARIVGEHFSKSLGQQIVVENVAGAGGTTGITRGAQAPADGYTIMMGHMGTHGAAPALYPNMKYDPAKDFAPIGLTAGTPILIVSKKGIPAKDLKEFIAYMKANGDKMNEANAGVGSVSHTTCTLFNSLTGTKTGRIAYRGTGPAMNDLVGGQVDYGCDQIVNLVSQIKAGNIKAYAIATKERSPALPDVPTTTEAGLPEYEVSAWNALFAPKNTPKDVMDKLVAALDKALEDPTVKARLLELGSVLPDKAGRSPAALQKLVETEVARWSPVLKGVAAAEAAAAAAAAAKAATPATGAAPAAPATKP